MAKGREPNLLDDPFCIYAYKWLNITPSGQVRPCCAFHGVIEQDGRPMTIYEHSLEEIWSSDVLRNMRRDMLAGKRISACRYCYKHDQDGAPSIGTNETRQWRHNNPGFDTARFAENDFVPPDGPDSYELDMGNLCNLKCRMCNSNYSSAIASDPIHSVWAPPGPVAARWKGDRLVVAPSTVLGVTYDGFGPVSKENGVSRSWIENRAALKVTAGSIGVSGVAVRFFAPEATDVEISANGESLLRVSFTGDFEEQFEIPDLVSLDAVDLTVTTSARIAVEEISLLRNARGNSRMPFSRLSGGDPWYNSEEFLNGELLRNPETLRTLRIIGGEPLLIKETRWLMRRLIDLGAAKNIQIWISTNATHVDDDWFDIFAQFRQIGIVLSLDGFGAMNDYIRYPSDWSVIDGNIRKFAAQPKISLSTNMTVQAYNLLNVAEMYSYCDDVGIIFGYHTLQTPHHLTINSVPDAIRLVAQKRIRDYAANLKPKLRSRNNPQILLDLAKTMDGYRFDPKAQENFYKFTAQMDKSRGQSLEKAVPELWRMLNGGEADKPVEKAPRGMVGRLLSLIR